MKHTEETKRRIAEKARQRHAEGRAYTFTDADRAKAHPPGRVYRGGPQTEEGRRAIGEATRARMQTRMLARDLATRAEAARPRPSIIARLVGWLTRGGHRAAR